MESRTWGCGMEMSACSFLIKGHLQGQSHQGPCQHPGNRDRAAGGPGSQAQGRAQGRPGGVAGGGG